MRSWIVAVGVAAALLTALGVYLVVGSRPGGAPPPPVASPSPSSPSPSSPSPSSPSPSSRAAEPAAAHAVQASPAPAAAPAPAEQAVRREPERTPEATAAQARRDAAREKAVAERTAARELAAAQRRASGAGRAEAGRALAPQLTTGAPAPVPASDADRPLPAEATGAIAGRLVDERGLPLPAISVLALATDGGDGQETLSDDDGAFLVPGLRPGRYVVFAGLGSALASRLGARGVDVRAARVSSVDVRELQRGGTVRVSAAHPDGRPASGEALLVSGAPGAGGSFGPLLGRDVIWMPDLGAGRMVLQKVPPGTYTLVLLLDGGRTTARAALEPVVVGEGEVAVSVRLGDEIPPG